MPASMDRNNDLAENSDMGIDIPTASNKPPGIAAFRRATPDSDLADLAISLLLIVQESKVLKLPSGSKEWTSKWKEVFLLAFYGRCAADGQRDKNGIFSGYVPWSCSNPASAKLKPLVMDIIDHYSMSYSNKESSDDQTPLEVLAHSLKQDIVTAEQSKREKLATKLRIQRENVNIERSLGFRSPALLGVSLPSLSSLVGNQDLNAISLVGQRTESPTRIPRGGPGHQIHIELESTTDERAMSTAAASFTSVATDAVFTPNNNEVQVGRSRAVTEAVLAGKAAGSINNKTVAGSLKRARNRDIVDLTDNLHNALKSATNEMTQILKLICGSPNTKRAKAVLSIQTLIKSALEEIKLLKDMNSDGCFDDELKKAVDNLHDLYNQRDKLKNTVTNLADDMD